MPNLERTNQPIFGSQGNNDEFAVFGTMKTGTPVYSKTLSTLFQSPAFLQGWQNAVAADKAPFLEETNALYYTITSQLAYIFQKGIPEWDPDTTYYANTSFCQVNGVWYQSLTDENIGNNPAEDEEHRNWKIVTFGDDSGSSSAAGHAMFDPVIKDHILDFEESKGLALQGTYVYKEGVAGSRYGYPDFYNKCLEEYKDSTQSGIVRAWTQPVLTSNGTLGGDSFAVSSDVALLDDGQIYKAFDDNTATQFHSAAGVKTGDIIIYNPKPLNITDITMTNQAAANRASSAGNIYGSDDGSDWQIITPYTNATQGASATWNINLENNKNYYKYYKIESTAGGSDNYWTIAKITLTATEKAADICINSNRHIFYNISEKSNIDEIYEQTGIAWYYGVDESNERIFLPRNDWFDQFTGDINEVNKYVPPGAPDIQGSFVVSMSGGVYQPDGCVSNGEHVTNGVAPQTGSYPYNRTYIKASDSNPIYGNSESVQPPSAKKLLYICVGNTEVTQAQTNVVDITTSENDTLPLFTGMYFDFKPNHASWLHAGTSSGKLYESTYNELVGVLNGTITKYGPKLKVIEEKDMQPDVDYSLYWKINQDDMTFTTPEKISYLPINADSAPVIGNGTALGLINERGEESGQALYQAGNIGTNASIYGFGAPVGTTISSAPANGSGAMGVTTQADKSGLIADLSAAKSTTAELYFKVANAVENLEILNAGEVLEALNDKVNARQAAHASMPSASYIDLTPTFNLEYTAIADGYVYANGMSTNTTATVTIKNLTTGISSRSNCSYANWGNEVYIPVRQGDKFAITDWGNISVKIFRFYYAEGANNVLY